MNIDILTENDLWHQIGFDSEELCRQSVMIAMEHAQHPSSIANRPLELSVLLTDDVAVQRMNRDFRGKDKATNVLSFATLDDADAIHTGDDGPFYLGDIALALETLQREALEQDKPLRDHFTHLVVHGTLHLLGYDHMEEDDAETMELLEIKILKAMSIENPYSDSHLTIDRDDV